MFFKDGVIQGSKIYDENNELRKFEDSMEQTVAKSPFLTNSVTEAYNFSQDYSN